MKYARHPQKFDNPDPELQRQWLELKEVLCDNEYMIGYKIMVGQPVNLRTIWNVITTAHTDTTNIWSHIIFAVYFAIKAIGKDSSTALLYLLCGLTFLGSVVYHILRNYSRRLFDICLFFDVSGIGIQVFTYLFLDSRSWFKEKHPEVYRMYQIIYTILLLVFLTTMPVILRKKLYSLRTIELGLLVCSAIPPFCHKLYFDGWDEKTNEFAVLRVLSVFFQFMGLVIRSAHYPERLFPHTIWQYYFHSHLWFHTSGGFGSVFGAKSALVYM